MLLPQHLTEASSSSAQICSPPTATFTLECLTHGPGQVLPPVVLPSLQLSPACRMPSPHVQVGPLSLIQPSQSSSCIATSQTSMAGSTSPVHGPYAMPSGLHVCVPAVHWPTPSVPGGPE